MTVLASGQLRSWGKHTLLFHNNDSISRYDSGHLSKQAGAALVQGFAQPDHLTHHDQHRRFPLERFGRLLQLTEAERRSYYAESFDATAVSGEAARLTDAEALVLVFPTWWYGFPAILKGWFDRVWSPGIAFDHSSNFGPIKPRLKLARVLAITTIGSPWWIDTLVLWQPVRRILRIAILGACARSARFARFLEPRRG